MLVVSCRSLISSHRSKRSRKRSARSGDATSLKSQDLRSSQQELSINPNQMKKFAPDELKKIETIRLITADCHKDLGKLLENYKGTTAAIPIFGYPLICYSPNALEDTD